MVSGHFRQAHLCKRRQALEQQLLERERRDKVSRGGGGGVEMSRPNVPRESRRSSHSPEGQPVDLEAKATVATEATQLVPPKPMLGHTKRLPSVLTGAHKVSTIELLTDLVFVVALKITADKLETDLTVWPGMFVFVLRIFMFWVVWHMGAVVFNLSQRLDDDGRLNLIDYLVMYLILINSVFMARTVAVNDDMEFVYFYLATRLLQACYSTLRVGLRARPEHIPEEQYEFAVMLAKSHILMVIFCEAMPLATALVLRTLRAEGTTAFDALPQRMVVAAASAANPAALTSFFDRRPAPPAASEDPPVLGMVLVGSVPLLVWIFRLTGAMLFDYREMHRPRNPHHVEVVDVAHLMERYELIILIFLGEMVFAAATPGPWYLSMCTVLTLIACFVLYFRCRPHGGTSPWSISHTRALLEALLHMLLFVAIGALGAGWALQIHNEHRRHELHEATEAAEEAAREAAKEAAESPAESPGPAESPAAEWQVFDHGPDHPGVLQPVALHAPDSAVSAVLRRSLSRGVAALEGHASEGEGAVEGAAEGAAEGMASQLEEVHDHACFAGKLLIGAAAAFLILSAFSTLNNRDPTLNPPRLPNWARFVLRASGGVAVGCLALLPCEPALNVGIGVSGGMVACAFVEWIVSRPRSATL